MDPRADTSDGRARPARDGAAGTPYQAAIGAAAGGGALAGLLEGVGAAWSSGLGLGPVGVAAVAVLPVVVGVLAGAAVGAIGRAVPWTRAWPAWAWATFGGVPTLGLHGAAWGLSAADTFGLPAGAVAAAAGLAFVSPVVLGFVLTHGRPGRWAAVAGVSWALAAAATASSWPSVPEGGAATRQTPSLLFVTVRGLRADRLGDHPVDTPALDRLAAHGVVADAAVTSHLVPEVALADLFLARPPGTGGEGAGDWLADLAQTLPVGVFVGEQAATSTPGVASAHVVDDAVRWPLGWTRSGVGRLVGRVLATPSSRRAGDVVDRALRFVRGRPGRYVAWVHLVDPTAPYAAPAPFDGRYAPAQSEGTTVPDLAERLGPDHDAVARQATDPAVIEAAYDGEVAYVDAQLARLLDALDDEGRADSTLVVVVGLHGEALAEGPLWFSHEILSPATASVPVLVRLPERIPAGRRLRQPLELPDVAATARDLMGLPDGGDHAAHSLRPMLEGTADARSRAETHGPDDAVLARTYDAWIGWTPRDGFQAWATGDLDPEGRAWSDRRVRDALTRLGAPPAEIGADDVARVRARLAPMRLGPVPVE